MKRPYLYGMIRVLGIRTTTAEKVGRKGGKPAQLISQADVEHIRSRLKANETGR